MSTSGICCSAGSASQCSCDSQQQSWIAPQKGLIDIATVKSKQS